MLIDFDLKNKTAMIVGGGREAELKAIKLLDSGARTTVVSRRFTAGLKRLASTGALKLIRRNPSLAGPLIRRLGPSLLFICTANSELDAELASLGRSCGLLVCVVDAPALNDFNMPAIARIGALRVGISSGGKSPAMAKILRERIEETIRPEDLLQVELQHAVRGQLMKDLKSPASRKRIVYKIIRDGAISRLLREGDLKGAERRARRMIQSQAGPKRGR